MIGTTKKQDIKKHISPSREGRSRQTRAMKAETREFRENAQGLIQGFRDSRSGERAELRKGLAKDQVDRKSSVREMLDGFRNSRKQRTSHIHQTLGSAAVERKGRVGEILAGAEKTINGLGTRRMKAKQKARKEMTKSGPRTGIKVVNLRKDPEKIVADRNNNGAFRTEGVREPPASGVAAAELETMLLALLGECSQGVTLIDAAERMGVFPIVLGRAARGLIAKGKIKKEDRVYSLVSR